ncbi:TonB-dependent siderophore receptor [Steroidobacter sp.]|uniref:TonB-dependent siderophore receptor n=1 Tax=Steroidobacter sp. TaxID=1978227 RepID=UPI001A61C212|nr:TonB-dependent receptor [Steroidobacter sp.]MBL8271061.1 TonB-dependent siderophore receptor [Steroidobacter sp.]
MKSNARRMVAAAIASLLPLNALWAADIKRFDLEAQDAAPGLQALALQGDFEVFFPAALVKGRKIHEVRGEYTPAAALDLALRGTGLKHRVTGEGTYVVEDAGGRVDETASIETVNVFGTLDDQLSIGGKSGASLRETPKSVTVVTRERIEAQNLTSLAEVLSQTSGVVVTSHSHSAIDSFFYSRGFRVQTLQFDGGAPAYTGGFGMFLSPDTAAYDHVEMLRGVDGIYTGAGQPGGVVNLVRKRAKATPQVEINLSAGSWNEYRGEFDATGPLTEDGRLRGRFVAAYKDNEFFYDRGQSQKTLFFGTGEYDITPSTLLVAGASYERRKEDGFAMQGHPRYANGDDLRLPRSTAFNPEWAHWYLTSKEAFARIEQSYGNNGVLKLNATRIEQQSESRQFIALGFVDPVTLTGPRAATPASDYDSSQNLLDLSASGTFALLGREHRYTVGADYSKVDGGGEKAYRLSLYTGQGPYGVWGDLVDVFNFDPSLYPRSPERLNAYYPENSQSQHGFYAALGLQLLEPLRLTLGGRYGEYRYLQVYQSVAADGTYGAPSTTSYEDSAFVPSAALSWDFSQDWSAYVSYAETFEVQAQRLQAPLPGKPLDPITGGGFEAGVKGEVFGVLNASAAVYRVEREGQGIRNPLYPNTPGTGGASCCFLGNANVTTQGFDAELSGTVLPGWQVYAGYGYFTNEYEGLRTTVLGDGTLGWPSGVAYALNRVPKHMFKMWTTWQLPDRLSRWTVNAGVTAQTASYIDTVVLNSSGDETAFRAVQDSYALWNASIQYRLGDTWTIGLYGDNLLDERYYQVLGSESDNTYGRPRSFVVSVRGHW